MPIFGIVLLYQEEKPLLFCFSSCVFLLFLQVLKSNLACVRGRNVWYWNIRQKHRSVDYMTTAARRVDDGDDDQHIRRSGAMWLLAHWGKTKTKMSRLKNLPFLRLRASTSLLVPVFLFFCLFLFVSRRWSFVSILVVCLLPDSRQILTRFSPDSHQILARFSPDSRQINPEGHCS